jgi:predicted nucleic acid-binding protein
MNLTIDTSALIAVIGNETRKQAIIASTKGYSLVAPSSVHWEIGNAFSAMLKRGRTTLDLANQAMAAYRGIPIRYVEVALEPSIELSHRLNIYAYDAYLIQCALQTNTPLLTLDGGLLTSARKAGAQCMELIQ